jgi:hypothetical protein
VTARRRLLLGLVASIACFAHPCITAYVTLPPPPRRARLPVWIDSRVARGRRGPRARPPRTELTKPSGVLDRTGLVNADGLDGHGLGRLAVRPGRELHAHSTVPSPAVKKWSPHFRFVKICTYTHGMNSQDWICMCASDVRVCT